LGLCLALTLSACSALLGPSGTPTPAEPSATPAPPTPTAPPAAAIVNGERITQAEFEAELERFEASQSALGRTVPDQEARQRVLDDLIAQTLLAQAARANGFELGDSALQAREAQLAAQSDGVESLAVWKDAHGYTDESFRLALKRAAEAAWMRDRIVADVPLTAEQVHIQQILTYNEETAGNVLAQLENGAEFEELAPIYDPATRGELGWVPRGYLLDPQVEQAAFALEIGEFSQVIATHAGFHILLLLDRDLQRPLAPDARLTLQELALQDWLQQERQRSDTQLTP
jgi:parvulin-like peptidyl-prolyl isomerase